MADDPIRATPSGARLRVHVQPRASRTEVVGLHGDAVKVRVAAPPVEGAANDEVIRLIAGLLGIPKRDVRVVAGATDRRKQLEITGRTPEAVRRALGFVFGTGSA